MIIAAVVATVLFFGLHRPASAMVEFCPATLRFQRIGPESEKALPGALYGFELSALGPRTITSATLAFDTSGGWFTVDVPGVTLNEKDRHYSSATASLVRRDYVAPILYVRFPTAVSVSRGWVYNATTQRDSIFGWDTAGTVQCDPAPQQVQLISLDRPNSRPAVSLTALYKLDPRDDDMLSQRSGAVIIDAKPSKPLENFACTEPFRNAMVKLVAAPQYPTILREVGAGEVAATIQLAIGADGMLQDAWVAGASGYEAADAASLAAARASTYEAARAYCRPVRSEYYFYVEFDP